MRPSKTGSRGRPGAAVLLIAFAMIVLPPAVRGAEPETSAGDVLMAGIRGPITPVTLEFVEGTLTKAGAEGRWAVVVFEMDTPGGLVESTDRIVQSLLGSEVPVVVWVTPAGAQATSAGLYIANAADLIAMTPGTKIGAGHPVMPGGENPGGNTEEGGRNFLNEKVENTAAAGVRSIAVTRGRNAEVYERMVRESISLTAEEALEQNVVNLVVGEIEALTTAIDGRTITRFDGRTVVLDLSGAGRERFEMTARQKALLWLTDPRITFLLFGIGMLGLYIEFNNPGLILPGVAGALALILFLMSVQILPVNVLGIVLIILAVVLFILEFNIPSYGLLTVGGVLSLTFGFLTLFDVREMPSLEVSLGFVVPTSATIGLIMGLVTTLAIRAQRGRVVTGAQGLPGELGDAVTDIEATGKVFVHGEYWNARSAGAPIPRGTRVRVRRVRDMQLDVEPADPIREDPS